MKKFSKFASLILLLSFLVACSSASGTQVKMIEPGDRIGGFTITSGIEGNFIYGFAVECADLTQPNSYSCAATVGQAINISTGLRGSGGSGDLDDIWAHSNYQLFVNDQPVDLASFGTIDYNHPAAGIIRFANVVITAAAPGSITVRDAGVFDNGDPFTSTSTYVFSAP